MASERMESILQKKSGVKTNDWFPPFDQLVKWSQTFAAISVSTFVQNLMTSFYFGVYTSILQSLETLYKAKVERIHVVPYMSMSSGHEGHPTYFYNLMFISIWANNKYCPTN